MARPIYTLPPPAPFLGGFIPDIGGAGDDLGDAFDPDVGGGLDLDLDGDLGGGGVGDDAGGGTGSGDRGDDDPFLDGLSEAAARTVAYLYEAALDRDGGIDADGLNFWIDRREAALSEKGLAERFLDNAEFEAKFGRLDEMAPREVVETFYRNVLDRDGEEDGIAYWTERLEKPWFDAADILLFFAASPENVAGSPHVETLEQVSPGWWDFA